MKPMSIEEIPGKGRTFMQDERDAEVCAFMECGAEYCEVEIFSKSASSLVTEYNHYCNSIWRLGLKGKVKPFTRNGRIFLRRLEKRSAR